jgi:DNA polymerase-3 subunit epsilon
LAKAETSKRINQHFTGTKCKKIQDEVFTVTYDETGSELIALLKESEEIKSINQFITEHNEKYFSTRFICRER